MYRSSRACCSKPRNSSPCGVPSAKSAPTRRSASNSAQKPGPNDSTPVSLAALSTENFGSAIKQMARYKQLTCPEEIRQEMDDEEWSIHFHWLLADEVEPPVLIECCFAWVLSIARHGTGTRLSPLRVEFVQPRHARQNHRAPFWLPGGLRRCPQRDRVSCSRRSAPVRHPQRRTPGHAGAAVRRRVEAGERRQRSSSSVSAWQFSRSSPASVPPSRTLPMRYISAPVLCSGVCRMKDSASSVSWKKLVVSLLATTSITPSSS